MKLGRNAAGPLLFAKHPVAKDPIATGGGLRTPPSRWICRAQSLCAYTVSLDLRWPRTSIAPRTSSPFSLLCARSRLDELAITIS